MLPMPPLSEHAKGLLITGIGVLVITPDSLLIRLVDTDVWTMVFWRGVLMAIGVALGLLLALLVRFASTKTKLPLKWVI